MAIFWTVAGAIIGAGGFWLRGSSVFERLTGRGATTARLVAWAAPLALLCFAAGLPWFWALAMAGALFAGSVLGWWDSLDMGRVEGTFLRDFAAHTARGVIWTAPAAAVLFFSGGLWWPALIAGALCGVCYEAGWRLRPPGTLAFPMATEVGELSFGALCGAAIAGGVTWLGA